MTKGEELVERLRVIVRWLMRSRLPGHEATSLDAASSVNEAIDALSSAQERIAELEGALEFAERELDEAADKFWVIHCNHPGKAVGRAQEEDKQFLAAMHARMTVARNTIRTRARRARTTEKMDQ